MQKINRNVDRDYVQCQFEQAPAVLKADFVVSVQQAPGGLRAGQ